MLRVENNGAKLSEAFSSSPKCLFRLIAAILSASKTLPLKLITHCKAVIFPIYFICHSDAIYHLSIKKVVIVYSIVFSGYIALCDFAVK